MDIFVAARDALCAGDLDFVFSVDGTGAVRFSYPPGVTTDTLYPRNFPYGDAPAITGELTPRERTPPSPSANSIHVPAAPTCQHPPLAGDCSSMTA